jgi:RNA polymerase sigma-70 factor (ECF subfamily)
MERGVNNQIWRRGRDMSGLSIDRNQWKKLLRRVRRMVPNPVSAEDCLHNAFVRLAERISDVTPRDTEAYLVKTACNLAIDEYRRDKVHSRSTDSIHLLLELDESGPLQDEILAARQRLIRVQQGIDRLPQRTQRIFLMHRIEGMKYREIAAAEQISLSAVEKHIAAAMYFLAKWARNW